MLVRERSETSNNEPVLLNSFFVDDLKRVSDRVRTDAPGAALASYLTAPEELDGADHFRELASHVLGEEAWGLMAAKLGNRADRTEFRSKFWFDRDADEEDEDEAKPPGMKSLLNQYRKQPVDWQTAVQAFEAAVAEAERLRDERQQVYLRGVRLRALCDDLNAAQTLCIEVDTHLIRVEAALAEATLEETRAHNALEAASNLLAAMDLLDASVPEDAPATLQPIARSVNGVDMAVANGAIVTLPSYQYPDRADAWGLTARLNSTLTSPDQTPSKTQMLKLSAS